MSLNRPSRRRPAELDHCDGTSTRLITVIVIYSVYVLTMLAAGFITHALVLISEGLHAISDWFSYCMTLWFHGAQYRPSTARYPFGWLRATVIGGVLNGLFLVSLALFITLEAIQRFIEPHQHAIDYTKVITIGCVGLAVNIGCSLILWSAPNDGSGGAMHGHSHFGGGDHSHAHGGGPGGSDVNIRAMFLHLIVDVCSSAVVLISGLVGHYVKHRFAAYVDPAGALLVASLAVLVAVPLLRHCATLLMQTPTASHNPGALDRALRAIPGVVRIASPAILWRLTDQISVANCYLQVRKTPGATEVTHNDIITRARSILEEYGADREYCTVQVTYDTSAPAAAGGVGAAAASSATAADAKSKVELTSVAVAGADEEVDAEESAVTALANALKPASEHGHSHAGGHSHSHGGGSGSGHGHSHSHGGGADNHDHDHDHDGGGGGGGGEHDDGDG